MYGRNGCEAEQSELASLPPLRPPSVHPQGWQTVLFRSRTGGHWCPPRPNPLRRAHQERCRLEGEALIILKVEVECQEKGCTFNSGLEMPIESTATVPDVYEHVAETGHTVGFFGVVNKEEAAT